MNTTLPTLHLGRGARRGALTVFPIWQASPVESPARLADGDTLIVEELNDERVEHLEVTATSGRKPVLIPDGDLLIGGLQNRVAIGSTLVAAGASAVIDVRCVEPERWDGNRFHRAGTDVRALGCAA